MDNTYVVLHEYEIEENDTFATEEEAIKEATKNLQSSHRNTQYVAVVTCKVISDREPVTTTVERA